ncbi:MAG: MG2 domain-containing protein [Bacteroidota bacterium]
MNRNKIILTIGGAALILAAMILIIREAGGSKHANKISFREYVAAYSAGTISTESTIKIRMTTDFADSAVMNSAMRMELFDFTPSIKGKTKWLDARTIEFKPDKKLPAGQKYKASFKLSKLIDVPDSLSTFEFDFRTQYQGIEVEVENIKPYNNNNLSLNRIIGVLHTADAADSKDLEKTLTATQDNKNLKITWIHNEDKRTHQFRVDSVRRTTSDSHVDLEWNGSSIDCNKKGDQEVQIFSLNTFKMVRAKVEQAPDQFVVLQFTDPLMPDQVLDGLVHIGKLTGLKFFIEDNEIRVFPASPQTGNMLATVVSSIKNVKGKQLGKYLSQQIKFEDVKPAVRLLGKGNILPSSNGLIFPFEAVNLRAVDVKIVKIFEDNVAQFLQVNKLGDDRELYRVGKVVLNKTVPLTGVTNYGQWNRFSLDLADLINAEPGAIYKVSISFSKKYSLYPCDSNEPTAEPETDMQENSEDDAQDSYGYYSDYSYDDSYYSDYYYDGDYNWYDRDNPCNAAYYSSKTVSRNILASDIGIITKRGSDGTMNFYVTDIRDTKPMSGVTLELLDFQQQKMASLTTDGEGMANTKLRKSPYLLIAKKGKQRGYLRLDDGSSLSLSMFDVAGESVNKGVKGFIYGERGVWRPGDSLFITFILEDKEKKIPEKHPVVFELLNPQGQVVKHVVKNNSVNGFYNFSTVTDANAPTGNWMARVKVGSSVFAKELKIETIIPNRLKIALDFGAQKLSKAAGVKGIMDVKWLHGAVARKLKTDIFVTLTEMETTFKGYKDFVFDDPSRTFGSESQMLYQGNLDDNGKAAFSAEINTNKSAPGMLKASFETRVFEESGAFSVDRFSLPYYPYNSFVGLMTPKGDRYSGMLVTDTNHLMQIVNLDANGRPLPSAKVKVEVYKVSWKWWWDSSDDYLANYVGSVYNQPVAAQELTTVNGKANYKFRVNYPDWGRYMVRVTDVASGHSTGKVIYVDWPSWYSRDREEFAKTASMLQLATDKEKYKVGDEVKITIPTAENGRALVSVETGSRVLESYWIETKKGTSEFSFEVKGEMAPNVYVHVSLLQPHGQVANDLPIRLYGVVPVFVEDPNTHLRPVIISKDVIRPEENTTISVKEENGKAMTYTLAVVDEGILDLTRFETPDPWKTFYAREALGVKTWDLYDYVMGAYGGDLERILSIGGGDEASGSKGGMKANRFKPMVKFFGPFALKKGQTMSHTFKMPQYVGSVRIMVIAGQDGAYGSEDKTVAVRKPLMVLGTLPRVIGPGETFKLPVDVFAMEKHVKNVNISITTNNLITIDGSNKRSLKFNKVGDEIVEFNMKVKPQLGIGKIFIVATSGNEKATQAIEIDVRNPNPKVTDVVETIIKPGETVTLDYAPVGMAGTNKGTLEVSSCPPINLEQRLKYLIDYPHGCIEQTTSAAFPQLYLADLLDLSKEVKAKTEKNIKAAMARIKSFQTKSGGLAYWPGMYDADEWGTSYAGHFMLEASFKGYSMPVGFLEPWKRYQKNRAAVWAPYNSMYYNSDLVQAYRLYTLALAKAPDMGSMNRLRELKTLSPAAKWRLAVAYYLAGQVEVAKKLAASAPTTITPYRELYNTYGSDYRDKSMIVEALSLMNMRAKAAPLVREVSAALSADAWMSTQTTAYSLLAISKYLNGSGLSPEVKYSYKINKGNSVSANVRKYISESDMKLAGSAAKGKVTVKNEGKSILYARVIIEGIPQIGDNTAAQNNMKLVVKFTNLKGAAVDPVKLAQGTDFIAEVTLSNPGTRGDLKQVALSMVFPSGWEIHNTRMDESGARLSMSDYQYQDFRDDRVYTYVNIPANVSKTYRVLLNASYCGRYYLPTFYAEAMYDATINARVPGKWVEVIPGL